MNGVSFFSFTFLPSLSIALSFITAPIYSAPFTKYLPSYQRSLDFV
jgi:hypothetical protein